MVKRVRPAVVLVNTIDFGSSFGGYGSGFIVRTDDDGAAYVLTNHHVVEEAEFVDVWVGDSKWYEAEILALDPRRDIGMLRICCGEFTTVDFMDSDTMNAGDEVITIGYPLDHALPGDATDAATTFRASIGQENRPRRSDGHKGHNLGLQVLA